MNIYIMAYPQGGIYVMAYLHGHLHHDIPTRSICIMTCPLEDILHLHFCKETFASRVNTCAGTIMDKLRICTPAWDICIMKITSLKGEHVHHMDISRLHHCEKHLHRKKSRLAPHSVCIHRRLTSRPVAKSLSIAY